MLFSESIQGIGTRIQTAPLDGEYRQGFLQGRRVINTTEHVNALRHEIYTQSTIEKKMLLCLGGVATVVAGVAVAAAIIACAILFTPGGAMTVFTVTWSAIILGTPFIILAVGSALTLISQNWADIKEKINREIVLSHDEKFINWAEQEHIKLLMENLEFFGNAYKLLHY